MFTSIFFFKFSYVLNLGPRIATIKSKTRVQGQRRTLQNTNLGFFRVSNPFFFWGLGWILGLIRYKFSGVDGSIMKMLRIFLTIFFNDPCLGFCGGIIILKPWLGFYRDITILNPYLGFCKFPIPAPNYSNILKYYQYHLLILKAMKYQNKGHFL
jgi:hypothetical protein